MGRSEVRISRRIACRGIDLERLAMEHDLALNAWGR